MYFQNYKLSKNLLTPISKKPRFRKSFDSQHVKGSQSIVNSAWEDIYHIFSSLWGEMIWEISRVLKFEIIGVFVNTLTVDSKYAVPDCENSSFPIQTQLS